MAASEQIVPDSTDGSMYKMSYSKGQNVVKMISTLNIEARVLIGCIVGPCVVAVVSHFVDFRIRPLAISRAEIERMAELMVARHGSKAEEMARIAEDSAWRRSHTEEQGKWRRVRRELRQG